MHALSFHFNRSNASNDPVCVDYSHILSSFPESVVLDLVAGTFFLEAGGADFFPVFEVSPPPEAVNQRNMFKQVIPDHRWKTHKPDQSEGSN